jgi:hypothetical protein
VRVLFPAATGTYDEWTKSAGTLHAALDETVPDDDSTMIFTDTPGNRYAVTMDALPAAETIHGVQLTALVRNLALSPSHDLLARVGGVDYYGNWQSVVQDEWRAIRTFWDRLPETAIVWTREDINASEWGGRMRG